MQYYTVTVMHYILIKAIGGVIDVKVMIIVAYSQTTYEY